MKKLLILFAIIVAVPFAVKCQNSLKYLELLQIPSLPSSPEVGFFVNVDGYPMWYNGVTWDSLNVKGAGGGGSSLTFSNALTNAGGNVTLGGDLTGSTTISNGAGGYNFLIDLAGAGDVILDAESEVALRNTGSDKFVVSSTENTSLQDILLSTGKTLKTAVLDANTYSLSAYDVDGAAYIDLITLTAGNNPTLSLVSPIIDTLFIKDTSVKISQDGDGNAVFEDGVIGSKTLTELTGNYLISSTTCTYNDTTYISVADTSSTSSYYKYESIRDIGVVTAQSGTIEILYDDVKDSIRYSSSYIGPDIGFDIQAQRFNALLRLMIIVDNNYSEDLTFSVFSKTTEDVDSILPILNDAVIANTAGTANNSSRIENDSLELVTQAARIDDIEAGLISVNTQTGTSYTLVLTDAGKSITMDNGSASTLTIPLNSSVAFAINTIINIHCLGAGQVTIVVTGGVTPISIGDNLAITIKGDASLLKTGTDTWKIMGSLE